MALTRVEGPAGAPWERPLAGALDRLVVESEVLADNPLGDPARRPLYVYVPDGAGDANASIYVIQGMTGQLDMWFNRNAFEPTVVERVADLFSGDDAPAPAVVVFVDAWTRFGGSQFVNSAATGRYMDYLCDEVVPFVDANYPTIADRDHRGIAGKSSGGYGAMVVPMERPDVFAGLASHAGDALFEACYLPEFPETVRTLRDHFDGSYEVFWKAFEAADRFEFHRFGAPLDTYAMAACYSPDEAHPPNVLLPFDVHTGVLDPAVWDLWLRWDPVRMAPRKADALRSMRAIYLDAGRSDEYFLDVGAVAFAAELDKLGVAHSIELFDGKHGGIQYRYPAGLRALADALV